MSQSRKRPCDYVAQNFENINRKKRCKVCNQQYSTKTSNHNLVEHLKKHNIATTGVDANVSYRYSAQYKLLMDFIIHGNHPTEMIEEEHFKILISSLNSRYYIPSCNQLNLNILHLYEEKKVQVESLLKSLPQKIAISLEVWTSNTNNTFIIITAHAIIDVKNTGITLDFVSIPYPYTSQQLQEKVTQVVTQYGIESKIISITIDNEATNVDFIKLFRHICPKVTHITCLTNCLSNAMKMLTIQSNAYNNLISDVAKLVERINRTPVSKQKYIDCCSLLNAPQTALLEHKPERWNSIYPMLQRASTMKGVLDHICRENPHFKDYMILSWDEVDKIINFLKPFNDATVLLSKSKYPCIMYVLPIIDLLKKHLLVGRENNVILQTCASTIYQKWEEFFPLLCRDYAYYSVILDPRLKLEYFGSEREEIYLRFKNYFTLYYFHNLEQQTDGAEQQNMYTESDEGDSIFSSIYRITNKNTTNTSELDQYLSLPREIESIDVFLWWSNYKCHFPKLSKMAFDILCIPACAIPTEQSFLDSASVIDLKRNRLNNNTRELMCLNSWLAVFK